MADLYCLKHKVYAYRNHKCSPLTLVPVKRQCRYIADKLYGMGIQPLSVAHFTHPVVGSENKHTSTIWGSLCVIYGLQIKDKIIPKSYVEQSFEEVLLEYEVVYAYDIGFKLMCMDNTTNKNTQGYNP
jgi:hypothetical protein